tara:strand:+ start:927 stop:1058 length:132 start_codon:yes stop_codon:yes gene_type:complete
MEDIWVTKAYMAQAFDETFSINEPVVKSNKKNKPAGAYFTSWF